MIVIDRIEGDRAVLEFDGELLDIPASALPPGAAEGALLKLVEEDSKDARAEARSRLDRLKARDSYPDDIKL